MPSHQQHFLSLSTTAKRHDHEFENFVESNWCLYALLSGVLLFI